MTHLVSILRITIALLLATQLAFANHSLSILEDNSDTPSHLEIKNNLMKKAGVFDIRYTKEVKSGIQSFTVRGRKGARQIIGRAQCYI